MTQKLNVLLLRSAFYTPVLLTAARFLPEAGIETNLIFRTDENVGAMLRSGELDFAQFAPSAPMVDLAKGIEDTPVHIAIVNERDGFLLIGRQPEPDFSWQRLEGKTVVPASFAVQPEACLRYALHVQGVNTAKVTLVGGLDGMAAAAKAYAEGTGDYVQLQDPTARNLVRQGKGHLVAMFGPAIGPIAFSSVATGRHMLSDKPDTVRAFLRAYRTARRWIANSDAAAISKAIAPWFESVEPAVLHDAIAGYKDLGTWTESTAISRESFETAIDMMTLTPTLTGVTERYPYDRCCNDSFALEIDAEA